MLPSQPLLHLPAQQQGGRLRLQATLVLGLWPNHTRGLGREAPCPATWQSGQEGARRGGHSMGFRLPSFLEPIPPPAWFSGRLGGMRSAPTTSRPIPTLPSPGQASPASPPLSKWVTLQLLAPPPRWQLLRERPERSQEFWLQVLVIAMTRDAQLAPSFLGPGTRTFRSSFSKTLLPFFPECRAFLT